MSQIHDILHILDIDPLMLVSVQMIRLVYKLCDYIISERKPVFPVSSPVYRSAVLH